MKNLILLFTALTISLGIFAQGSKMESKKMEGHKMKDCCMMKDGKMMCMKDGKTMAMDKDMTMKNGCTVMKDGTVKMKDGKTMKMKNGESIDMDGKMEEMDMDKKMK